MSAEHMVNRFAQVLIRTAAAHGYDLPTIFKTSGVQPKNLAAKDTRFGPEELAKLSRHVKLLMQDEFCGLTKSGCKLGAFELMIDLAVSGATLADSMHKAFRFYGVLSSEIRFVLATETEIENTAAIEVHLTNPEFDQYNFLAEWWLLVWWSISSWLLGEKVQVICFQFPHEPAVSLEEYRSAFSANCEFSQPLARMLFAKDSLHKPVIRNSMNLGEFLAVSSINFGVIRGITEALNVRLQAKLRDYFARHREFPAMEEIAKQYHLSSQTLRRRLEEENTSFRQIKDDIRREVVMKLLKTPSASLLDITRDGGFSDTSALARAVKGWTGLYPKQYRDMISRTH